MMIATANELAELCSAAEEISDKLVGLGCRIGEVPLPPRAEEAVRAALYAARVQLEEASQELHKLLALRQEF